VLIGVVKEKYEYVLTHTLSYFPSLFIVLFFFTSLG